MSEENSGKMAALRAYAEGIKRLRLAIVAGTMRAHDARRVNTQMRNQLRSAGVDPDLADLSDQDPQGPGVGR